MSQRGRGSPAGLGDHAGDLFAASLDWTRASYDEEEALVWNPPGSDFGPPRTLHLVPNSARFAYGLLGTGDANDRSTALSIVDRLIGIQYDLDAGPASGTYRRFLESPPLSDRPAMWVDYDPNWRQFVGSTFALMLHDFEQTIPEVIVARMLESIRKAVEGERDGRLTPSYTNPALLRSWLDAWVGARFDRPDLIARGERLARGIVEEFDRWGAFEEFNSPTYYGVDLTALALWSQIAPTPLFSTHGTRLYEQLWRSIADFYNPSLHNFCGPYTRAYHPDSTRSLSEVSLWIWGAFGRDVAPLPDLEAAAIHHSHDLMWGPVVARLVQPPPSIGASDFQDARTRDLRQELAGGRVVTCHIEPRFMAGAESSENDWGGWEQFMPVVAHWADGDDVCVLTLRQPRIVEAAVDGRLVRVAVRNAPATVDFRLHARRCVVRGAVVETGVASMSVEAPEGGAVSVEAERVAGDEWAIRVERTDAEGAFCLRFDAGA